MYMFNATPGSLFIRRVTSVMIKGPFRCGSRQFVDELDYFQVAVKKIVTCLVLGARSSHADQITLNRTAAVCAHE